LFTNIKKIKIAGSHFFSHPYGKNMPFKISKEIFWKKIAI